jgi:hypothetical protein
MNKRNFGRFIVLVLGVFLVTKGVKGSIGWFEWLGWYASDKAPIEIVGTVASIKTMNGRWHSGEERIKLCRSEVCTFVEAELSSATMKSIRLAKTEILISYVPLPTSTKYVMSIGNTTNGKFYYDRAIDWDVFIPVAVGALLLNAFLYLLALFTYFGFKKM